MEMENVRHSVTKGIQNIKPIKKIKKRADRRKHKEGSRKDYPVIHLNDYESNSAKENNFPSNSYTTSKYTLWSFPFKVLWEQLRKATTFYFTMIVIITLIPQISPLTPYTSVSGLVFIILVAAIREAYEDFLRHKADRQVNKRRYTLVEPHGNGERVVTRSCWLKVGELVYVSCDEPFPADLVLLASGNDDGIGYIETAQLDGETNLKMRKAPQVTQNMSMAQLADLSGALKCEVPHHILYSFKGTLTIDSEPDAQLSTTTAIALDTNQLLLRGANLRNTPWVVGVVAYAGPETKLSLNQKKPPSKMSTLDKRLNNYVFILLALNLSLCTTMAVLAGFFESRYRSKDMYLMEDPDGPSMVALKTFFSYFALLSYLIPLSLVVSLEIVKVFQARYMEWDDKMAISAKKRMTVKTSNLNDELGLVKYIFSDKTGTLTENQMDFLKCSVNGVIYDRASAGGLQSLVAMRTEEADNIMNFLVSMAITHSAVTDIDKKTGALLYKASSPDEEALCKGATANGVTFLSRKSNQTIVDIDGEKVTYEILTMMEFTSDRRRMSVIVRFPDGAIKLLSKGADSVMYERLASGDDELKKRTMEALDQFSMEGLRTLVYAEKELTEEEYEAFAEEYHEAETLIQGREEAVDAVCDKIERDLQIVGCSAIEDKLQHGVPEAIHYLLEANIRVWVITGDKQATAINIGYSSRLLTRDMHLIKINAESAEQFIEQLNEAASLNNIASSYQTEGGNSSTPPKLACVIDGTSLKFALRDYPDEFYNFITTCASVVCCRVTPLQKAKVVKLIKEKSKSVCLSIGDGANDVSMIQEANIGVGIYGKEGNQAARASDFALRQFRHLTRLVCVHGRYSLLRNALLVHYSFYKNAATFLVLIWFGFFSGFSAQTLYDDWIMTFFNITITSLPPLVIGVYEIDIKDTIIEQYPQAYRRTQKGNIFTLSTLGLWLLSALYHSIVFFFGTYLVVGDGLINSHGQTSGLFLMGNVILALAILVIFFKLVLITNLWNWLTHVAVWGGLLTYVVTITVLNVMLTVIPNQYFAWFHMLAIPSVWLWLLVGPVICLLPDLVIKYAHRMYRPDAWHILQENHTIKKKRKSQKTYGIYGGSDDDDDVYADGGAPSVKHAADVFDPRKVNRLDEPLLQDI
ncbi:Phospholipid-transporting ATPase [Balamuthia mandrillaris]